MLTAEMVTDRKRRLTSVDEAKGRLKKQPYDAAIKHLRKISQIISPVEKLSLISEACKKVD